MFLPVICFLSNVLQKGPQPGEEEQPKDTVLTGGSVEGQPIQAWAPEGIQSCGGAGRDCSMDKGVGNRELGPWGRSQRRHSAVDH